MSQTYDNKGQVALWPNEKYEAGGPHPRFKGNVGQQQRKPESTSTEG